MKAAISKAITGFFLSLSISAPAWAQFGVSCPGGNPPGPFGTHPTIQAAVDAAPANGPTTILIIGNCVENVVVNGKHDLSLRKAGPAPFASLTGATAGQDVLTILNSQNFNLRNVTVSGVSDADPATNWNVISLSHSFATVEGCAVQNAERHGILVADDSSLTLTGSTVQNNGANGLNALNRSSLAVGSSTIQNNVFGISVSQMSTVTLNDTSVHHNAFNGLFVADSSLARLNGDNVNTPSVEKIEVAHNGTSGINISGLSNLVGAGAHLIHHNGGAGISVSGGSGFTLSGQSGTDRIQIYMNGGSGLTFVQSIGTLTFARIYQNNQTAPPASILACGVCAFSVSSISMSATEISTDPGHGVALGSNSSGTLRSVSIFGNTGEGVHVERASGVQFFPQTPGIPTNISGNTGGSLNCSDNLSWMAGDLTGVTRPIKCTEVK